MITRVSNEFLAKACKKKNALEDVTRERPGDHPAVAQRVVEAGAARTGDWRYSVLPAVVPADEVLALSRAFFSATELLHKEGNTFGAEFEQHYAGTAFPLKPSTPSLRELGFISCQATCGRPVEKVPSYLSSSRLQLTKEKITLLLSVRYANPGRNTPCGRASFFGWGDGT